MQRYGRLYSSAVLRPVAEQLVAALQLSPGDTFCDVLCDGAELARAAAPSLGSRGRVFLADSDAALREDAADGLRSTGIDAIAVAVRDGVALDTGSCDRAGCLFTAAFADTACDEARRIVTQSGRAVIAFWDAGNPPAHEAALLFAMRDAGVQSQFMSHVLMQPPNGASITDARDVARFDGFASYWSAMVTERPLVEEMEAAGDGAIEDVQSLCRAALKRYEAADGTLRIPVTFRFATL